MMPLGLLKALLETLFLGLLSGATTLGENVEQDLSRSGIRKPPLELRLYPSVGQVSVLLLEISQPGFVHLGWHKT
jgi:hypothetical protein